MHSVLDPAFGCLQSFPDVEQPAGEVEVLLDESCVALRADECAEQAAAFRCKTHHHLDDGGVIPGPR
ncbi:MAG: hypothetical protein ACRDF8_03585 [Chloroflexota bacterium]